MRRFLALGLALVALIAAGFLWTRDTPTAIATEAAPPAETADEPETVLVAPASNVTPADREARRFGRYDKDSDAAIDESEYLANRRKSFGRLDLNSDGRLDFAEYTAATMKKFKRADRNGDGTLAATEFAATAVKRRAKAAPPPCVPEES
ncbi:hypothetical protein GCM10011529_12920 [Polymorphobacter glacialis]|uniref:EF-hand domain-containing protein n=1 Tax=Sandarakinorhabdus glacialis TaxID=1614636 RepID=A0A916ZPN0_9SPHN|nr:histidine kinase [Polymorphobacter glacialis]GGE07924.1 hypothetical protein GCM10011529_12920 [Polymorphobacter glacialis]